MVQVVKGKMYQSPEGGSFRKIHEVSLVRGLDRSKDRVMFYVANEFGNSLFNPPVMATCFATAFEGWKEVEPVQFDPYDNRNWLESDALEVVSHRNQAVTLMCGLLGVSEFTEDDKDRCEAVKSFVDNIIDAAKEIK